MYIQNKILLLCNKERNKECNGVCNVNVMSDDMRYDLIRYDVNV